MQNNIKPIIYITVGLLFILSMCLDYFLNIPLLATYVLCPATLLALVFIFQATIELLGKNPVSKTNFKNNWKYLSYFFSPIVVIPIISILGFVYLFRFGSSLELAALAIPFLTAMICVGYLSIYLSTKLFFSNTDTRQNTFILFAIVTVLYSITVGININTNLTRITNHKTNFANYQIQVQKLKELPLGSNSSSWNTLWLRPNIYTNDMIIRGATYNLITFSRYELFNKLAKCGDPTLFSTEDLLSIFLNDRLIYKYVYSSGISTYDKNIININDLKDEISICGQTYPISYFSEILHFNQNSLKIQLYPEGNTPWPQVSENIELNTRFQEYRKKEAAEWNELYNK